MLDVDNVMPRNSPWPVGIYTGMQGAPASTPRPDSNPMQNPGRLVSEPISHLLLLRCLLLLFLGCLLLLLRGGGALEQASFHT
jgi:hypothetical protein